MKFVLTLFLVASFLIAATGQASAEENDLPSAPSSAKSTAGTNATATQIAEGTALDPPATVAEARARARLLYETVHGSLQVMHRDFFNEEDAHAIPSASLEDVFHELSKSYGVKLRWLIVDTDIVNVDHRPQDAFEKSAAKLLAKGLQHVEARDGDIYRYAGPIRLASQCLKCHVKDRVSTEERTAGLLISMPIMNSDRPNP